MQLVTCIITSRLEHDFTPLEVCARRDELACRRAVDISVWITPREAKFGGGSCVPTKLVESPAHLLDGLTLFADIVGKNLPAYSTITACLANLDGQCSGECHWCDNVSDAYPYTPPLTPLCLPNTLDAEFCDQFKAAGTFTICPQEEADRKQKSDKLVIATNAIGPTGCKAGCTYKPKYVCLSLSLLLFFKFKFVVVVWLVCLFVCCLPL